jgi:DNA-binding response OmpR family regulator
MSHILVIDDNADTCMALKLLLESEGYAVEVANDGEAGLERQRSAPADLVITDIYMPRMEGMETIAELKREFPKVRIIAMSGRRVNMQTDYLSLAPELGASCTMQKPFDPNELLQQVQKLLG